jgi:predicted metal-binding transcription factor (methanogenesis marker protein 9)
MFDYHNVLQCNHNIISMTISTFSQHLILNTLLKCCKSSKPCRGQAWQLTKLTPQDQHSIGLNRKVDA